MFYKSSYRVQIEKLSNGIPLPTGSMKGTLQGLEGRFFYFVFHSPGESRRILWLMLNTARPVTHPTKYRAGPGMLLKKLKPPALASSEPVILRNLKAAR